MAGEKHAKRTDRGAQGAPDPDGRVEGPETRGFRILVVDDEAAILRSLEDLLSEEGYHVATAGSGREALDALGASEPAPFHLVITDLRMPPPDGLELLRTIKKQWPDTEVMLLTAFATRETAREAMKEGALEYVEKPYKEFEMLLRVGRLFERYRLARASARLEEERARLETEREALARRVETLEGLSQSYNSFEHLIARSPVMKEVFCLARKVAATNAIVLIRGESGTGKSVLARAIHLASSRRSRSFLKINCSALPESLLESELFGHERGAFTGAIRQKDGLFSVADGGTLFLDEIGDISPSIQLKLLQVIEDRTFLRVGGTQPITVDVRILAATNRVLEKAIAAGDFREDLFYRLNVFPILIPPLRDRSEDVPPLVERFLRLKGVNPGAISPKAMKALLQHPLAGNVRELENILERALILAGEGPVGPELIQYPQPDQASNTLEGIEIPDEGLVLEEVEKQLIMKALRKANGNKSRAAALLGLTRRTLYSRMERYRIKP
ncbi:MAG: sigma-54-dependent Fis family transcriptional regulator [Candidatus Eisenbacteria sp.]|nr:sigma-54-dependent Fis family transcriptional regulator [Candidatus Eisenbacteria bacterium]